MKRRIGIILGTMLVASMAFGQKIRVSFRDTPLPQALRTLSGKSGKWNINFIYDDIEDFRVTADVHGKNPCEAVRQLVAALPVKVGIDSVYRIISVERSAENPFMNQPTTLPTVTSEARSPQNTVSVQTPGTLSSLLTQAQKDTCTQLTVCGKLNSADIRVLRRMGGYKEEGYSAGRLQTLDLKDAGFVNDKEPYMVLDAVEEQLTIAATAGNISKQMVRMGLPKSTGIDMYSRHFVPNFMQTYTYTLYTSSVTYYKPKYFIGKRRNNWPIFNSDISVHDHGSGFSSKTAESTRATLCFADSFGEKEWRFMERKKVTHFKGHRLVRQDGRYLLYVSSRKGYLPHDMFCKCRSLRTVIMPRGMRVDKDNITDEMTQVSYCLPSNEVCIDYVRKIFQNGRYHPGNSQQRWMGRRVELRDADADAFIGILSRLKPIVVEGGYWIRRPRAGFRVEYADGSRPKEYKIDVDNKYVQVEMENPRSREFFKPSKELMAKLHELGMRW